MTQKEDKNKQIHINVTSQNYEDLIFKIKLNTKFKKLFDKYYQKFNIEDKDSVRFIYDGEPINEDQTPESINIGPGEVIECV